MDIGLSEFSFGYAFLYEQTRANWGALRAAPVLPSLQEEADFGWDARLPLRGVDFYYQFKLTDWLYRSNAKFIQDGTYTTGYYRIALHRAERNRQHQRLRALSQTSGNTFYAAPELRSLAQFNTAFLAGDVMQNSRLIPVALCQDINDADQHYITFQPNLPEWTEHSDPIRHDHSTSGEELRGSYENTRPHWRAIDLTFAEDVLARLKQAALMTIGEEIRAPRRKEESKAQLDRLTAVPAERTRGHLLAQAAQVASTYFGTTLVVVGVRQQ